MDAVPTPQTLGGGRFEVRGTLGAGGAGVVYRVNDRQLGREVALKLLRTASGRDLYRFKREFRELADIAHPGLVALHELHHVDGDWFFTMEIVEGVSFIDWVRPPTAPIRVRSRADIVNAKLDEERLRAAFPQLADALSALHRAGKLHRDLKPSNVLVTKAGRLALLDFGLIAGLAEANPDRLAVGTPAYMSPEQASDQSLTEASDWYSLGAMLYEALTGRRPFEGEAEQVMTRKQTEIPRPPTELAPALPADLTALCVRLLAPRADERPDAATIFGTLGARPSATRLDAARSTFVGRERELGELTQAFADAKQRSVAVMVRGPSGIGKSTLVRKFLRSLGDAALVVEGKCFEREAVPFKMLDGVVDQLAAALVAMPPLEVEALVPRELGSLVRMFPVLRRVPTFSEQSSQSHAPVDPQELRRRGFHALKALVARLARVKPVVVFVDDAHWGDADSAGFLAELIHRDEAGVLVLAAHRPEDYLGMIAQLRRPPGTPRGSATPVFGPRADIRELEVVPFTPGEAARLVESFGREPDADAIAAAAGNPLVLTEVARDPVDEKVVNIDAIVRTRMARLSPDAQAMLAVSSIAARPLSLEIAAHAAGVAGGLDAAMQLVGERLATLRETAPGKRMLHPAHDYVRAALLATLDTEAKAGWHETLARAFEAVQGEDQLDSQAVVEHWLAAGHPANAAHHAVGAALAAEEAFAFKRAAELYQIALTFGPWDALGQRDLLRRKAYALVCAGQLDEAARTYEHAAQLVDDAEAVDLERLRVEAVLRRGKLDEALPAAEKLLAQIGIRIPLGTRASRTRLATQWVQMKLRGLDFTERDARDVPRAELLAIDVLYSIASGLAFADPTIGRVVQSELMKAALDAGEPMRVCLALSQEVCYAAAAGSRNRGAVDAVGKRLKGIAVRHRGGQLLGFADTAIGIAAHMSGRWRDARGHLEAGLQMLRDHGAGVRWEIDLGDSFWLATLFYLGAWKELAEHQQSLLREALDRSDPVAQQNLRIGRCNLAWLVHDQPDEARAQLAIAEAALSPGFHLPHLSVVTAAVNLDLYAGSFAEARARLEAAWPHIERLGCLRLQQPRIELAVLRARALLGDATRGEERLKEVRRIAEELGAEGAPWASALAHLIRAAAHAWAGASKDARVELLAAEEQLLATGMMGYLQVCRVRRGRIEGGPAGEARTGAALELLKDLGALNPEAISSFLVPWPG